MTLSILNRRSLTAGLGSFTLAGALFASAAGVASAASPAHHRSRAAGAPGQVQYSDGFNITNLSSHTIKLINITGDGHFEGRPADGSLVNSMGGAQDIEVSWRFMSNQSDTAHYAILDDSGKQIGTFDVTMTVAGSNGVAHSTSTTSLGQVSGGNSPVGNQTQVTLLDPAGTVHDIPAGQGQQQADALKQFCSDNSSASCSFAAASETDVDSPSHQVGKALINNTDSDQETDLSEKDEVSATNSVGVDVSVNKKILESVEVGVQMSYKHSWTQSHEFDQDVKVTAKPYTKVWVMAVQPMLRDTGDFTIKLGNTTWILRGVYFDSPNPNGAGAYIVNSQSLDQQEQATLPQGFYQN